MLKWIALFSSLAIVACTKSEPTQPPNSDARVSQSKFVVGPKFISMPVGYFVLVRKGRALGAFHLTSIHFTSTSLTVGQSTYESYYQPDRTLRRTWIGRQTGIIDIKPTVGLLHSLPLQFGQAKLRVGDWWFGCYTPNLVNMSAHFSEEDTGFEFAPTSAREILELDAFNPHLHWYRYLTDSYVDVPLLDLPK